MSLEDLTKTPFLSRSEEETGIFAKKLAETLKPNTVLLLRGEVGAGKTFFSSHIAKNFGADELTSSSFACVAVHAGRWNLIHCDFYRKRATQSFFDTEIEPHLAPPWLLLIEWPERMAEREMIAGNEALDVHIQREGTGKRKITVARVN